MDISNHLTIFSISIKGHCGLLPLLCLEKCELLTNKIHKPPHLKCKYLHKDMLERPKFEDIFKIIVQFSVSQSNYGKCLIPQYLKFYLEYLKYTLSSK